VAKVDSLTTHFLKEFGMVKNSGKKNTATTVIDIPVAFGGVSIGDETCRLGVRIMREVCNINSADEVFCGHRLHGKIVLGHSDDSPGQTRMFDDEYMLDGTFDVKRISVSPGEISTGLTFNKQEVDVEQLARFAKGSGRLIVETVEAIPDDSPAHADDPDHVPGSLKASGPWAEVKLSTLFEGSLLKKLKAAGLETVGQLSNYTASEKRLTDIEGIGPGASEKIENRMMQFWSDNPNANEQ
jgi:hypothetical protein